MWRYKMNNVIESNREEEDAVRYGVKESKENIKNDNAKSQWEKLERKDNNNDRQEQTTVMAVNQQSTRIRSFTSQWQSKQQQQQQ